MKLALRGVGYVILAAITFIVVAVSLPSANADERQTVGYIEHVLLYPGEIPFRAKIDTGARTSSIDVREPILFERDGKDWVRFTVVNRDSRSITLERPIVRTSKVRRSGTAKQVRNVVKLNICLGEYFKQAEFNLNDRSGMSYKMLIGRLFLADRFFVDASAKNLTMPDCQKAPQQ